MSLLLVEWKQKVHGYQSSTSLTIHAHSLLKVLYGTRGKSDRRMKLGEIVRTVQSVIVHPDSFIFSVTIRLNVGPSNAT